MDRCRICNNEAVVGDHTPDEEGWCEYECANCGAKYAVNARDDRRVHYYPEAKRAARRLNKGGEVSVTRDDLSRPVKIY